MSRRAITVIALTTAGAAGIYCTIWMYRSVTQHGLEGTLRYVWEGDYYSEDVRDALDDLENLETQVAVQASLIDLVETSLERATLNGLDDDDVRKDAWVAAHGPANLEKDLAKLSYDLDKAAAKVDAVLSKHPDVKSKKKLLSSEIVSLMSSADEFLSLYQRKKAASAQ